MKDVLDDRTIVLVGSWNVAILNPDWIARKLFEVEEVQAQITISAGRTTLRYKVGDILVSPESTRVVVSALSTSNECLQALEDTAARLLQLLPITPVTAVGINFGYIEEQIPQNIANIFNTDDVQLLAARDLPIKQMNLIRHLTFDDREIRFKFTITEANTLRVHFNYHKAVLSATAAREAIVDKTAQYRDAAQAMLAELYQLELEGDE